MFVLSLAFLLNASVFEHLGASIYSWMRCSSNWIDFIQLSTVVRDSYFVRLARADHLYARPCMRLLAALPASQSLLGGLLTQTQAVRFDMLGAVTFATSAVITLHMNLSPGFAAIVLTQASLSLASRDPVSQFLGTRHPPKHILRTHVLRDGTLGLCENTLCADSCGDGKQHERS